MAMLLPMRTEFMVMDRTLSLDDLNFRSDCFKARFDDSTIL